MRWHDQTPFSNDQNFVYATVDADELITLIDHVITRLREKKKNKNIVAWLREGSRPVRDLLTKSNTNTEAEANR